MWKIYLTAKKPSEKNGPVTLRTLASYLGLSLTTVSVVVSAAPAAQAIPLATRQRILEAANELQYRPNYFARSLRRKCSMSVNTTLDDAYGDSLLAHGTIDNLSFASPLPVDKVKAVAAGAIQFSSDTNWLYTLEQSTNFQTWTPAAPASFGSGTNLMLQATNSPAGKNFYRVRADLP